MIIINPDTRQFNVPGAELVFGVESDAGSERKYFQCPRYVGDNLDLTSCFVRMNFRNANGEMDSYLVDDVTVDGENVTFSWVLSEKAVKYKGHVKFVVCAVGPNQKVEWHTTLGTGMVLEGLEPEIDVVAGTTDVVAQLIAMVEQQTDKVEAEGAKQIKAVQAASKAAETASVTEIEAKGVNTRNSIPADYTALGDAVDGLTRGKAGAIVCEAEGTAVAVSDASGNYIPGLRIFGRSTQDGTPTPTSPVEIVSVENPVVTVAGKNLIPYPYDEPSASQNGMTLTPQPDGGIAVSGTPTGYVDLYLYDGPPLAKRGKITISIHGVFENVTASLGFNDATGTSIGSVNAIPQGRNYITVNLDDYPTAAQWLILIKRVNNNQPVSGVIYPQLELGEVPTEYEPYIGATVETTHPLRGIPVTSGGNYTDESGQQWICDEVDLERGVYVQRVFEETVSAEKITQVDNAYVSMGGSLAYFTQTHPHLVNDNLSLVVSNVCVGIPYTKRRQEVDLYRCYAPSTGQNILVLRYPEAAGEKTVAEAKSEFAGAKVVYALATPIETPLSETEIAAYRALHSNYPNTTVLNDAGAHMVVKYAADTKLYIDNKIKEALQ